MPPAPETWLSEVPTEALAEFVAHARWFGGKGRAFEITDVRPLPLTEDLVIALATVTYGDAAGGADLYQLPLSRYDDPIDRIHHALVHSGPEGHVYDAVHDRVAMHVWLERFAVATDADPTAGTDLQFRRCGDHALDLESHSTLFPGEQSNSSVAFGDDAVMKVFRRVTPGLNPDIEIHEVLTRAGSQAVAHLYGWAEIDGDPGQEPLQLAMLQKFLRTASDGWELALVSARNLFVEADLHADEVGGDFASEAHRLGMAVSEVHELLRTHFGAEPLDGAATAQRMLERLHAAVEVVPDLEEHAKGLAAVFDDMAETPGEIQRVHGDLHLGQTLRTSLGWKLVDFEGEPAKALAERRLPDSPWRDVAGMLRSFDYAARTSLRDFEAIGDGTSQLSYRATEWIERNRAAFLEGYVEQRQSPLTEGEQTLIAAYEADKAVYEVVYEARNRPTWLAIPLDAVARIGGNR
jgi:maltokinase